MMWSKMQLLVCIVSCSEIMLVKVEVMMLGPLMVSLAGISLFFSDYVRGVNSFHINASTKCENFMKQDKSINHILHK